MDALLAEENVAQETQRIRAQLMTARLTTFESFDFSFQPSLDRHRILTLAQRSFIGVLGILPPNIAKTARGRASRDFWRPITYRLSAGSLQSMPLNPQVLADRLSVRTCIYPGG